MDQSAFPEDEWDDGEYVSRLIRQEPPCSTPPGKTKEMK